MSVDLTQYGPSPRIAPKPPAVAFALRYPTLVFGAAVIGIIVILAVFAGWLSPIDPNEIVPEDRLMSPGLAHWFGTDRMGRDIFSRVLYGTRVSLTIGLVVAVLGVACGVVIGLFSGFFRRLDAVVMRVMDGIMAIPSILLAIALVAMVGSGVGIVIVALTIPEVPRVARLVRSMVLSIREQPHVEAAIATNTSVWRIVFVHILPNTLAPLFVQATFICAHAILGEAYLSFLGAGPPPDIPTWGNIIAEARSFFQLTPWVILIPGAFVGITVLAVNLLGDGLRDLFDPRRSKIK